MKKKKLSNLSFIAFLFFLLILTPIIQSNAGDLNVKIRDTGYTDLDQDSNIDDIYVYFDLVNKEKDNDYDDENNVNEFILKFYLTSPSGYQYSCSWYLELDQEFPGLHFTINALNTATEVGLYNASVYLYEDVDELSDFIISDSSIIEVNSVQGLYAGKYVIRTTAPPIAPGGEPEFIISYIY